MAPAALRATAEIAHPSFPLLKAPHVHSFSSNYLFWSQYSIAVKFWYGDNIYLLIAATLPDSFQFS